MRVHVIPRKALFDPSAWRTTELEHKQALLDSLGSIRSTCAISCKTQRELTALHDLWQGTGDHGMCPTLWIGRTYFARRPMARSAHLGTDQHVPSDSFPKDHPEEHRHLQDHDWEGFTLDYEQSSTDRGGSPDNQHSLNSYGNPLHTPLCQGEGEGHLVGSQGTVHHEAGGTQSHRPGHGTQPSGASQPRDLDEDHPGRGHRRGREGDKLRPLQDKLVQGHPDGVPLVGDQGDGPQRQLLGGLDHVCPMGEETGDELRRPLPGRPGGDGSDTVCPGRERTELGHDLRTSRECADGDVKGSLPPLHPCQSG